jgi:uncharacterized protein (TIGR00661 family)
MKRIFYGLCGEGLGHASRALAVIDHLKECEVHIFTYGKAETYFRKINYPHLHSIDGLMFSYSNGKVDYLNTFKNALSFYMGSLSKNTKYIKQQFSELRPDLFISDFEPSVARAAKQCGRKLLSIDNQHRFAYVDMIELPWFLRLYGWGCGLAAKMMVPRPDHWIISTFHFDKIKVRGQKVTLTNGLLRKDVAEEQIQSYKYVLVYLRDSISDKVLNAIKDLDESFIVFGASDTPLKQELERKDNFDFYLPSPIFTHYLATCKAVISTAGNQLLTEARYYGKPVVFIPEPGQYEQSINAHYACKLNLGHYLDPDLISETSMRMSLTATTLRLRLPYRVPNGVDKVVEVIRSYL